MPRPNIKQKKLIKARQAKKEKAQHSSTLITFTESANPSLTHDSIQDLDLNPSEYVYDFLSNIDSSPTSNSSSNSSFDPTFNFSSFNHTSNSTLNNPIPLFSDNINESLSLNISNFAMSDITNLENSSLMSVLSSKTEKIKNELIKKINHLPEKELHSCSQLLMNMVYPDGPHKNEI